MSSGAIDDSGHRALAGFYYQSIMTAALVVDLHEELRRDDEHDGFTCVSIVRPEEQGQDAFAVAHSAEETIAKVVQHKFSETPNEHPIRPGELFEIFRGLHETVERVAAKYKVTTAGELHSNRPLSPESNACLEAAKENRAHPKLDAVEFTEDKDGEEKTRHKGRTAELNRAFRQWLCEFNFNQRHFIDAVESLENRAASFGVLENELSSRVARIMGELFTQIAHNSARQITLSDLDRCLTNDDSPTALCSNSTTDQIRYDLSQYSRHVRHPPPMLKRNVFADHLHRIAEEPIVQVYGEGGVGKSVLVFEHLISQLSGPPPFIGVSDARRPLEYLPGECFCRWRNSNDENIRTESLDSIVSRLEMASSGQQRPLLIIFIDGIDERDPDSAAHIIRRFASVLESEKQRCLDEGERPRVQLYVTCREPRGWDSLVGFENPFRDELPGVYSVKVERLSDAELHAITDSVLDGDVCRRIQHILMHGNTNEYRRPQDEMFDDTSRKTQDFVDAMRHPPFLAALRRVEPADAINALGGDSGSRNKVARHYICWFMEKVVRRRKFEDASLVGRLLNRIVTQSGVTMAVLDFQDDWLEPLTSSHVSMVDADRLFREALSGGIVFRESHDKWRWRNEFVCLGVIADSQAENGVQS